MSVWKRGRDLVWKTFLYQLVMSFFGIMMFGSTSWNAVLSIIGMIASLAFYAYILLSQAAKKGARMAEYDHRNQSPTSPFHGFWLSSLGFLPMAVMSLINKIFPPFEHPFSYSVFQINRTFQHGMYLSIYDRIFPTAAAEGANHESYASFLSSIAAFSQKTDAAAANAAALDAQAGIMIYFILPGILLSGLAYLWGYKNFTKGSVKGSFRKVGNEDTAE